MPSTEIDSVPPSSVRRALGQELARTTLEKNKTFETLAEHLATSADDRVRLEFFKFLYEQAYGKAPVRQDANGGPKKVEVRFELGKHAPIRVGQRNGEVIDAEVVGDGRTRPDLHAPARLGGAGGTHRQPEAVPVGAGGNEDREDGR